jgi:hypothetical protein
MDLPSEDLWERACSRRRQYIRQIFSGCTHHFASKLAPTGICIQPRKYAANPSIACFAVSLLPAQVQASIKLRGKLKSST